MNWKDLLGWSLEQLEELRLVGFTFLKEGKYDDALLFFKSLILLDPSNAYDRQTLGALYLQLGDGENALKYLDEALLLDPSHNPTKLNKVKAFIILHKRNEALALARALSRVSDLTIAGDAQALVATYT